MNREDEIIALLREIREAQERHQAKWKTAVDRGEAKRQEVVQQLRRAKRKTAVAVLIVAAVLAGAYLLPVLLRNWSAQSGMPGARGADVDTAMFDGRYTLKAEESFRDAFSELGAADESNRARLREVLKIAADQFADFEIRRGVIRSGTQLVQEFRLTSAAIDGNTLTGRALWHEDISDPGDCDLVNVKLELDGRTLRFYWFPDGAQPRTPIVLERTTP